MTGRTVPEWIGATPDAPVPPRVRLRVFQAFGGRCAGCGVRIVGRAWTCDHKIALINGGENREANLQPLGDACCNPAKNRADVAEKSRVYKKAARHAGVRKTKGRPMLGTKASGWKQKIDGSWERRQ
jgi:5-methylcytosine-specific restriction endonuclease McrA